MPRFLKGRDSLRNAGRQRSRRRAGAGEGPDARWRSEDRAHRADLTAGQRRRRDLWPQGQGLSDPGGRDV